MRNFLLLNVLGSLLLAGCGGESRESVATLPPSLHLLSKFASDPFPTDAAASDIAGPFTAIAGTSDHTCGIRSDTSLWCWGDNRHGQLGSGSDATLSNIPVRVVGDAGWEKVVTYHEPRSGTCGMRLGKVYCWGDNQMGEIDSADHATPRLMPGATLAREKGLDRLDRCYVETDHSLWCNYSDNFGELGNGEPRESVVDPVRIGTRTDWLQVVPGSHHTCANTQNGELWCWGSDEFGQLGIGRKRRVETPALVGEGWTGLAVDSDGTCGLKQDHIWCWGRTATITLPPEPGMPIVYFWGSTYGFPTETQVSAGQIWSRDGTVCALNAGSILCWEAEGVSRSGDRYGCATGANRPLFCLGRTEADPRWKTASQAPHHVCAIDQADKLFCWGTGAGGLLGVEPQVDQTTPQAVSPAQNYSLVSAGTSSTCAISTQRELYCWGNGSAVGNGRFDGEPLPARITPDLFLQVSVRDHACAVRVDGALFCWGSNGSGQLGAPALLGTNSPQQVGTALDWTQVEVGARHTCAINRAKQLYCWGENSIGQIGIADAWVTEPVRVWPR